MKTYLEEYKIYLREVKRCSDNTFEAYIRDLEQFIKYCTAQDISSLNNIKEEHINEYLSYILNNGRAASTKTRVIALKLLCRTRKKAEKCSKNA